MTTFNPLPILTPNSSLNAQQLQLIHQVQNHLLSPLQAALLGYLLSFPLPISLQAKLNIYYSFSPFLGSLHVSPIFAAILIFGWPLLLIGFFIFCYYLYKFFLALFRFLAP